VHLFITDARVDGARKKGNAISSLLTIQITFVFINMASRSGGGMMDVVWLKKDVRLHDHGPFAEAAKGSRPFCVVYIYEPDQLSHHSVHGSHVHFANEGIVDLDMTLRRLTCSKSSFCITLAKGRAADIFSELHRSRKISRILAHEETGHNVSYARDRAVRRWCRGNNVSFVEFNQTGVTRGLKNRDNFTRLYNVFMSKNQHRTPSAEQLSATMLNASHFASIHVGLQIPGKDLPWIPQEHVNDREQRQRGGETLALTCLETFLARRGEGYSRGISSPITAWSSCSRLSPYFTFGHISLRRVMQKLKARQENARQRRKIAKKGAKDGWLKSLASFSSRLRWRSHFIQKFENEVSMEHTAQCRAYDDLRRGEGEWNEAHFKAWKHGKTGFPMVSFFRFCTLLLYDRALFTESNIFRSMRA